MLTITPAMQLCYRDHPHHCPNCNSDQLDSDEPQISDSDDEHITCLIHCRTCNAQWLDLYAFVKMQEYDPNV